MRLNYHPRRVEGCKEKYPSTIASKGTPRVTRRIFAKSIPRGGRSREASRDNYRESKNCQKVTPEGYARFSQRRGKRETSLATTLDHLSEDQL